MKIILQEKYFDDIQSTQTVSSNELHKEIENLK